MAKTVANVNRQPSARVRLLYEIDSIFNGLYDQGLELTATPPARLRRERFYNLVQLFRQTLSMQGQMAECGCWNGLSSFLICKYASQHDPAFQGEGYHVFDSFEGLSAPTEQDALSEKTQSDLIQKFGSVSGAFAATLEKVKAALSEFPAISYHKGWIPDVFHDLPEGKYKFVHIDMDLYEPTRAAIEYFYPRLEEGGLIVCDDYGSLLWGGPRRAMDEYSAQHGVQIFCLSTAQAVLSKSPLSELERLRFELGELRAEWRLSQDQLREARDGIRESGDKLQERSRELSWMQSEHARVQAQLESARAEIHFMKSTLFWRLRNRLCRWPKLFGK